MITVKIFHDDDQIGLIKIESLDADLDNRDYLAQIAVSRSGYQQAVGFHTVNVHGFGRKRRNVLSLIEQILCRLRYEDMHLEPDTTEADLQRKFQGRLEL